MSETNKKPNYAEEAEEIENEIREEKQMLEREKEILADRGNRYSNAPVIISLIMLTTFSSGIIVYAVYSFLHAMHISDIAGVHVTSNVRQIVKDLTKSQEEKDREAIPGYENWPLFKNKVFEIMYPADWEIKKSGGLVELKKYNSKQYNYFDSLAAHMVFGEFNNPGNLPVAQVLNENHRAVGENPKEKTLAGKKALCTEGIILSNGLIPEGIYWPLKEKIFYAETTYYGKQTEALKADCQKVANSLKFLQ